MKIVRYLLLNTEILFQTSIEFGPGSVATEPPVVVPNTDTTVDIKYEAEGTL